VTISVVQFKGVVGNTSGGTTTVNFTSNVTAGNTIIVWIGDYNTSRSVISCTTPQYNSASVTGASTVFSVQNPGVNSANIMFSACYMLPNVTGGHTSVSFTLTNNTGGANSGCVIAEVSGLGSAPVLDSGASPNPATASNDSSVSNTISSGSTGNITSSPELIVGGFMNDDGSAAGPGAPWTVSNPATGGNFLYGGYQVVTSSGSAYAFTGTQSTGLQWAAGVAAIQVTPAATTPGAPLAAAPGPSWRKRFQPWRKAATARVEPPQTVTVSGSVALAPMAMSGTVAVLSPAPPLAATPGRTWRRVFQPWRKAAQQRVQPPQPVTVSGSVAMAPMAMSGSGVVATVATPLAAAPGRSWQRVFQPWRKAALQRQQPPAVITVSGSVALAPMAMSCTAVVGLSAAPPAATPGPAWQRVFQPWRKAAGQRVQPPAVVAVSGSVALAPMALSGSGVVASVAAPLAAAPAPAWQRVFQPWRRAAAQRVQPPQPVTVSGSIALAPMAMSGTATAVFPAAAVSVAQPGPAWRRVFQPWRKAAGQRVQPPATVTVSGSVALAPMALSGSVVVVTVATPPATPGPSWQRVFQPWRRAAQQRVQPPVSITVSGTIALAPMAMSGAGTAAVPAIAPAAATPGRSWRRQFQPWRRGVQAQQLPPQGAVAVSGSVALAPMAVNGTCVVATVAAPAAATPAPSWRQRFQPWRKAAQQRVQPPAVITVSGSVALAPMALSGSASAAALVIAPPAAIPGPAWRRRFRRKFTPALSPPTVIVTGLHYVTLTIDLFDGAGFRQPSGLATFTPTAVLTSPGNGVFGQIPVVAAFRPGQVTTVRLLSTDSNPITPPGWEWTVTFSGMAANPAPFSFLLPYASGAAQFLSSLTPEGG
jgi:hypothetical protein